MGIIKYFKCKLGNHNIRLHRHIKGDHDKNTWVALIECRNCKKKFIMSEAHQAFLRYDNNLTMKKDILFLYPKLRMIDL